MDRLPPGLHSTSSKVQPFKVQGRKAITLYRAVFPVELLNLEPLNTSPLEFSEQPDDPPGDTELSFRDYDRGVFFVLRFERDHAVFLKEALQGRFAVDQRADDLAVFGRALLLYDHPVAVHDADADHAVACDLERECFPLPISSGW